ncbi:MAG TPA: hypothetical protein VKC61_06600 [Pyrinomonadaceae bacterium]|nr:hypothetical protein [Pyrinomonadaceae bacterium]
MAEMSQFKFFAKALWVDFKQNRKWKVVTISHALLGFLPLILWFLTPWTPGQVIGSWSLAAKAILVLVFGCLTLVLMLIAVVDGTGRLYSAKVSDLEKVYGETISSLERKVVYQANAHGETIKSLEENHKHSVDFINGHHQRDFQKVISDKKKLEEDNKRLQEQYERLNNAYKSKGTV